MRFDAAVVRRVQAERLVCAVDRGLREPALPRQRLAQLRELLDRLPAADLSTPANVLLYDCMQRVCEKDRMSQLFPPGASAQESAPAVASPLPPRSAPKKEKRAGTAEDAEETTSAERIQALLQARKDLHEREMHKEHNRKSELLEDLVGLTAALKESTLSISHSVRAQNVQLDEMQFFAAQNAEELDRQKRRLTERRQGMSASLLANLGTVLWVVGLFVATYVVIVLFPASSNPPTCAARAQQ